MHQPASAVCRRSGRLVQSEDQPMEVLVSLRTVYRALQRLHLARAGGQEILSPQPGSVAGIPVAFV
jgi:hypothetical protein